MCDSVASLVARGREVLDQDPALWLALERAIEIAGEAATQVSDETRASWPDVPWRQLIAVRVRLAHAYFRIDTNIVWEIAVVEFPRLAAALKTMGTSETG
jgi:uncharacterized protein with HEPN domain